MLTAVGLIQVKAETPVSTVSDPETIAYFNKEFKKGEKYVSHWGAYLGDSRAEYEDGFHDGLSFALLWFPHLGTDTKVREMLKKNQKRKKEYQMGFLAAFEVYTEHAIHIRHTKNAEQSAAPIFEGVAPSK